MSSFPDVNKAAREFGLGGRFKFQEGDNKVRLLAASSEPIATHFTSDRHAYVCVGVDKKCPFHGMGAIRREGKEVKPSIKYITYLLDRASDSIVLCDIPYSVMKAVTDLLNNADWAFEGLPMPYDITIKYDPKAAPADMYKVIPSPKRDPISQDILDELASKKLPDDILETTKNTQIVRLGGSISDDGVDLEHEEKTLRPEDLPF